MPFYVNILDVHLFHSRAAARKILTVESFYANFIALDT